MKKILIIRFSSIGDIVLTTPVIRCIKQQLKEVELHYVTKETFAAVLKSNPNIDRLFTFKKDISEIYDLLQAQKYDLVIDLHKNLRSFRLKQKLKAKSYSFDKINIPKFLAVNFKMLNALPSRHIVERYLDTVKDLGVTNDHKGLDYFIDAADKINAASLFFEGRSTKYIALVVGGSYYTKKIPINKLKEICSGSGLPVLLMGGKEDLAVAYELQRDFPQLVNTCGKFSISQSASIIQQAEWVITSDTGLMHIASAFDKKIISVWGNTIPQFGMEPYLPNPENKILEIKNLSCRPCSKLGYKQCPKGHFKCMNQINYSFLSEL